MAISLNSTAVTMSGRAKQGMFTRAAAAVDLLLQARATRRLLAEMDPRMLSDIGVSRSQALHEANRAFWDAGSLR